MFDVAATSPGPTAGLAPLTEQRAAFSLPSDKYYLNCAYQSPLARVVEAAGIHGIRMKCDPSGILPNHFFDDAEEIRRRFARLVNAPDPLAVTILPSVSYGVAIAIRNLRLEEGRNVVMAFEQFPGNVYGWRSAAQRTGAQIRMVSPPDEAEVSGGGRGSGWTQRILDAIDQDTAVVTLGNVHWADGTLFELPVVAERARSVGAALVIDGTQSVGALPFDVQAIRPDMLIVAGYKWLLGPYSIALAYVAPHLQGGEPLEEGWITRGGSEDFQGLVDYRDDYQPGAIRYDVGERSNFILLPMLREALGLLLEWRPERIQEYCRTLMTDPCGRLAEAGYGITADEDRAWHITGVRMPEGMDLREVSATLAQNRIYASLRGNSLRVSPNVYNTPEDVDQLVSVLVGLRS
jgi:selenocysteine lyase/cysteine desulfurase